MVKYTKLTQIEHILKRPGMYIGSIDKIIDNMDIVSGSKNIIAHFWVPIPRLMSEMDACFKQVPQGYATHTFSSVWVALPHVP